MGERVDILSVSSVHFHDVLGEHSVLLFIRRIEQQKSLSSKPPKKTHQIEPTQQAWRHFDVLCDGFPAVVVSTRRIGGGENGNAGGERADDAGLGDGDGLLLHRFQQNLLFAAHFVELVDAAQASIAQHQRARFQAGIPGDLRLSRVASPPYLWPS